MTTIRLSLCEHRASVLILFKALIYKRNDKFIRAGCVVRAPANVPPAADFAGPFTID
jgi:hypothetical protein